MWPCSWPGRPCFPGLCWACWRAWCQHAPALRGVTFSNKDAASCASRWSAPHGSSARYRRSLWCCWMRRCARSGAWPSAVASCWSGLRRHRRNRHRATSWPCSCASMRPLRFFAPPWRWFPRGPSTRGPVCCCFFSGVLRRFSPGGSACPAPTARRTGFASGTKIICNFWHATPGGFLSKTSGLKTTTCRPTTCSWCLTPP